MVLKNNVSVLSYSNIRDWFSLLLATGEAAAQAEMMFIPVVPSLWSVQVGNDCLSK